MILENQIFGIEEYKIKNDGLNRKSVVDLFSVLNSQVEKNVLDYRKIMRKVLKITYFDKGRLLEVKNKNSVLNEIYTDNIDNNQENIRFRNIFVDGLNDIVDVLIKGQFIYVKNIETCDLNDKIKPFIKIAQDFSFKSFLIYPIATNEIGLERILLLTSKNENDIGYANLFYVNYIVGLLRNIMAFGVSNERYEAVFNSNYTGYMILDDLGHIIEVNNKCTEIFGFGKSEMIDKHYNYFVDEKSKTKVKYNFNNRVHNRDIEKIYQVNIRTKNKVIKNVKIEVDLLNNNHNRIIKISDITKQVILEKKNKILLEKYHSLFNNSKSIMLIIDPVDGQILDANKSAISFYGYKYNTLINLRIGDINILSESEVKEEMNLAKSNDRSFFLFKHKLATNEIKDVEVYSGPIVYNNKTVLYSIIIDISERKRLIKELNQKNNYEESLNRIQSELVKENISYQKVWEEIIKSCRLDAFNIMVFGKDEDNNSMFFSTDHSTLENNKVNIYKQKIRELCSSNRNSKNILDINIWKENTRRDFIEVMKSNSLQSIIVTPLLKDGNIYGALVFELKSERNDWFLEEKVFLKSTASILKMKYELSLAQEKIERQFNTIVMTLSEMLKYKDPYTYKHQLNVKIISELIAKKMKLNDNQMQKISIAALLHDIGKLNIPMEILTKPGKILRIEYELIK